ncbi:MAG: hypothetical protein QM652_05925 [Legionella sp.]|uniref:LirA/MavJ family T4SS effector n=1 Tax=Legionella sp. TaxID=459 RepID=UPI0039E495FD
MADSEGALRFLLRMQLQKYNIETQNELYIFAGFVPTKYANSIVRNGGLFKEQYLRGTALAHGLYSHYLQWYILSRAMDEGKLKLKDNLTLLDVLKATVDVTADGKPVWALLIDFTLDNVSYYNFRIPHDLNHALLFTEKCSDNLPYLQGYLLNSWHKNIKKMQKILEDTYLQTISYNAIIEGQFIADWAFGRIKLGMTTNTVEKYYQESAKIIGVLSQETRIVEKNASLRFANITKRIGIFSTRNQSVSFSADTLKIGIEHN